MQRARRQGWLSLRHQNVKGALPHRLRAGFFWRDVDPEEPGRWLGVGAAGRPRGALPLRRTGGVGCGGWLLRRLWGGRGPGRSGPGLERPEEPRGLRRWRSPPAGGFWGLVGGPWVSLVGFPGSVFGLPVGPVLDRLGDPGNRLQDREEKFLDRIVRRLRGSAPEKPPRQPPPETLAEQADQVGDDGERGGGRHGGYVSQPARRVK